MNGDMVKLTYRESFDEERRWDRKILLVALFHSRMQLKYGSEKWKIKNTAKYFCKSLSYVSENLKIAEALQNGLVFNSRKQALSMIPKHKHNNG